MDSKKKTWFITGCSQGLGLSLTQTLLEKGYQVAATARNLDKLKSAVGSSLENFLPLEVDILNENSVKTAIETTISTFKTIDVLVNNAGYGLIGGIEESSHAEVKASFDVNVFGLLNVTRAILPHMRAQKSGYILNISSVFGLIAGAGWGIYCGTKFAVEGISEALAQEVAPFGIDVTVIEPGYIRTNFLSSNSAMTPTTPIAAYEAVQEEKRKHTEDIPGNQIGDPQKMAEVMVKLFEGDEKPLRILLGSDALQFANYKLQMLQDGIETNKDVTLSTDF